MEKKFRDHRRKICEGSTIVLFCLFLLAPLFGQIAGFSGAADVEKIERRNPVPVPSRPQGIEELKKLPERADSWLNDAFGFRSFFSDLNNLVLKGIDSSGSDRILLGREGWLFQMRDANIEIEKEYRGTIRVRASEIRSWLDYIRAEEHWLRGLGIPLIKAIFPYKQMIYPDFLPRWARKHFVNRTDLISEAFSRAGRPWIDTRKTLIRAGRDSKEELYYRTDTHWNNRGAFVAYTEIMETVREVFPAARQLKRRDFRIGIEREGIRDLMRIHDYYHGWVEPSTKVILKTPTHIIDTQRFKKGRWKWCRKEKAGSGFLLTNVRTDLLDAPRVLIARDSFTTAMAPFLNESFREILYCPEDNRVLPDLVYEFNPDLVLFLSLEKSLAYTPPHWKAPPAGHLQDSWSEIVDQDVNPASKPLFLDGFENGDDSRWLAKN